MTAPNLPCFSAIGKIGGGAPFEVGTNLTFKASSGGEFFLGVNDSYYPDNSGSFTATITVPSPTPLPSDCYAFKGSGDQPATTGGPTVNSVIASSAPLQSISSYLVKKGARYPLTLVPGIGVGPKNDPNAGAGVSSPIQWGTGTADGGQLYLFPDNLSQFARLKFFNVTAQEALYHELDHEYYMSYWPPGEPSTVTAPTLIGKNGDAIPLVMVSRDELQHILIHNDLVRVFGKDIISLSEALGAQGDENADDDAQANATKILTPSWPAMSPPPSNSTCRN